MLYRLLFCLLTIGVALNVPDTYAYAGAYLVNGNKHILIADGYVGFTTATDTIKFGGGHILSFEIERLTKDSILLRRPRMYTELAIPYSGEQAEYMPEGETRRGRFFRDEGQKYQHVVSVQGYEYRRYALKDITTFQYPSRADERGIGCMGCVIAMVIPGVNAWVYYRLRARYHPSNYKMSDGWHFEVKE